MNYTYLTYEPHYAKVQNQAKIKTNPLDDKNYQILKRNSQ